MKKDDLKTARTILKGCSIVGFFKRLNCDNFCLILTKVANLHFFYKVHLIISKQSENDICTTNQ